MKIKYVCKNERKGQNEYICSCIYIHEYNMVIKYLEIREYRKKVG